MCNDNWLDRLAVLRQSMPEGEDPHADETEEINETPARQSGRLDIIFERKGRAGKCATIIAGFTINDEQIDALASEMKRTLGTGGSARGGEILIQGDRRQDVLKFLTSKGMKARVI